MKFIFYTVVAILLFGIATCRCTAQEQSVIQPTAVFSPAVQDECPNGICAIPQGPSPEAGPLQGLCNRAAGVCQAARVKQPVRSVLGRLRAKFRR